MSDRIILAANNAAVDAIMITKAEAIDGIRNRYGLTLDQVATIGDELIDIPMLDLEGLGKVGTVANAQEKVKDHVASKVNGYVSDLSVFDGFVDFYDRCRNDGIQLVVSDKDGVLKEGANLDWGPKFAEMAMRMGNEGNPYCVVLTGSGLSQNEMFRKVYGLDERLRDNESIRENPYLLLVENGAIHVNVLTGETENYCSELNPDLLALLKGPFEEEVASIIEEEILPDFGFSFSYNYDDQTGKVYHIRDKQAGVSFNIPREDNSGKPFRKTNDAQVLRDREIEVMCDVAANLGMDYVVL